MINLNSSAFQCETLFYQPTYKCGQNCSNCYVKAGAERLGSTTQMSQALMANFLDEVICKRNMIQTNQFTMSVDVLPRDGFWEEDLEQVADLTLNFATFMNIMRSSRRSNDIEVHITAYSALELERMIRASKLLYGTDDVIPGLNLLSLSKINITDDVSRARELAPGAKINLNCFGKQLQTQSTAVLEQVDMVYAVLNKSTLGGTLTTHIDELEDFMISTKDSNLDSKLVLDHCVSDAYNRYKNGDYTCSANTTRFTVWPTGQVTGCAYNSIQQFGKPATVLSDIVDNLKDARSQYDFNHCTLPNSFVQLRNRKYEGR